MFDERLLNLLPPIMGGEQVPGQAVETPPAEGGLPPEGTSPEGESFSIDGRDYTGDEIRQALESHHNRSTWEPSLKQKEMRLAKGDRAIKMLEAGFGIPVDQWQDQQFQAAMTYQMLETRLRTEEGFAGKLSAALEEINKGKGMAPRAARELAREQVETIREGDGQVSKGDPRYDKLERSIQQLTQDRQREREASERAQAERVNTAMQNHLWGVLEQHVTKYGKDYDAQEQADIADHVISRMFAEEREDPATGETVPRYTDEALKQMARDGTLVREIERRVQLRVKALDDRFNARLKKRGTATVQAREGAPPPPTRGTGASSTVEEPSRDPDSIRETLHQKARRFLTGQT